VGSSEIMRLFIAREAVDHHFKTAFPLVDPKSSGAEKRAAFGRATAFYPAWYLTRWVGGGQLPASYGEFGILAKHLRWAERHTRKLGRALFHAMVRFGPKLERRQLVLFRAVDIGAELFAIAAACTKAHALAKETGGDQAIALADLFCREARGRVEVLFDRFYGADDAASYRVAQQVLRGEHAWLERGIIDPYDDGPVAAETTTAAEPREVAGVSA
jgi:hypothetical protein